MNLTIRKATKEDLGNYNILKIEDMKDYSKIVKKKLEIPSKTFIKKEFFEIKDNKDAIFLFVFEGNKAIGYLVGNIIKNKWNHFVYIGDIFVKKNFRRKGVGTALIKEVEKICKTRKIKSIRLDVSIENKEAIRIYENAKFNIIKYNMEKVLK